MRTVLVVTRVGCRFGRNLPDERRVRWWARLATEVAAGGIPDDAHWVWQTAGSHLALVQSLAPERVTVVAQDAEEIAGIPGDTFTTVRLDCDDRYAEGALDLEMLAALPPSTVVSWPVGFQIDLETGVGRPLDYRGHHLPPFLAVTQESRADMLNVGGPHTEAGKGRKVREVLEPSWLQLVGVGNTTNVANKWGKQGGEDHRWPVRMILERVGMKHEQLAFEGGLDRLAARFGTDKGSAPGRGLSPKRYVGAFYQPALEPVRQEPIRLLELGVQAGASIRTWLEYLPAAKVAGVDVKACPNDLARHPRYRHFRGSQDDPALLAEAVKWLGGLDCWIDDASHLHKDHVASYEILWPWLNEGGWAALEDLHVAAATVEWLKGKNATFYASDRLGVLRKPVG